MNLLSPSRQEKTSTVSRIGLLAIADTHFSANMGEGAFWRWLYWAKGIFGDHTVSMPLQTGYDLRTYRDLRHEIKRNSKGIDAVLHVGDVADTGEVHDLEAATKLLHDLVFELECKNISVMPGNHDRYSSVFASGRSDLFEEIVAPAVQRSSETVGWTGVSGTWVVGSDLRARVVGYDFTLAEARQETIPLLGRFGQGIVSDAVLNSLDGEIGNCELQKIVLSHFPPVTDSPLLGVQGGRKIVDKSKSMDALFVLCGHTHNAGSGFVQGDECYLVNAGTATAFGDVNTVAFITIELSGDFHDVSVDFYVWEHGDGFQKKTLPQDV